jgi:CheY-like chemotaxis protein
MLRRLIGEDVRLTLELDASVDRIRADPGQIAQVIMNLAVNSRDAMPEGGDLRIGTSNLIVDEAAAARYGTPPGPHVVLSVEDTGVGMDALTMRSIFEPFFTTKEVGKGTGLGLATVYGIVRQSGGGIEVDSEPGRGTIFRIILPSVQDAAADQEGYVPTSLASGSETLLLVEDEAAVRALVARVLRRAGYTVLECANGADALRVAEDHEGRIDGVVTDVVMPGMSGPQLVEQLLPMRPGVRVLYMSGYTRDEIDQQGLATGGVGFIQKPMSPVALASAVRAVLDGQAELRLAS